MPQTPHEVNNQLRPGPEKRKKEGHRYRGGKKTNKANRLAEIQGGEGIYQTTAGPPPAVPPK